jgi:uncharacterized oligopeptide transporter (OPT) family protein
MYFIFFPLGHADEYYAKYFAEDDFYGEGERLSKTQVRAVRLQITSVAILSMFISAIVTPAVVGLIAATYLTSTLFWDFLAILFILKTSLLIYSLYEIRFTSIGRSVTNIIVVGILYIAYLAVALRILDRSFSWATEHILDSDFWGALQRIADAIIFGTFLPYLVFLLISGAAAYLLADPTVRARVSADDETEAS